MTLGAVQPSEEQLPEEVSYDDLLTVNSNDHSVYYDNISQRQLSPVMSKAGRMIERRETLRTQTKKPRSKSFEVVTHDELKTTEFNFTVEDSVQYVYNRAETECLIFAHFEHVLYARLRHMRR